jgi:hypothetical protein
METFESTYGRGLSIKELKTFNELRTKFFKGNLFVVLTDEELSSDEFKQYEDLLEKRIRNSK